MKYCDCHSDALTAETPVTTYENLKAAGCMCQAFAAFLHDGEGFGRAKELCDLFDCLCERDGFSKWTGKERENPCAMLTMENGVCFRDGEDVEYFARRGVKAAGLVWNTPNRLAFSSVKGKGERGEKGKDIPQEREKERGLTPFGREIVEEMWKTGILPDVSHASDRVIDELAAYKKPFVATHSGADAVYPHPRNLTDEGIGKIADSGGGIGLCFVGKFLSKDESPTGQKAALLAHARHILKVGGEDCLFFGSDFDGAPPNPFVSRPQDMVCLLELFIGEFGFSVTEKIASGNFLRIFGE